MFLRFFELPFTLAIPLSKANTRLVSSMNEIILCVGEVITLYDPQTAAAIVSFKTSLSPSRGTVVVKTKHGIGGLILSASEEKPILSVFSFQKVCSGSKHLVLENFHSNIETNTG